VFPVKAITIEMKRPLHTAPNEVTHTTQKLRKGSSH